MLAPPAAALEHLRLGNALARAGRLAEARSSLLRALSVDARLAEGHLSLAELQLEIGDGAAAAQSCRRALAEKPHLARAHCVLGEALARQAHYSEALDCARRSLQLEPDSAPAQMLQGFCLGKLARPDEALAAFSRALELDPRAADAQFRCAQLARSLGKLERAEAGFRKALELKPGWLAAHTELATVLRLQGRAAECETQCRAASALDESAREPWLVLAELRADQGRFESAEELFRHALRLDGDCLAAWAGIARVRRMSPDAEWLSAAQRLSANAQNAGALALCFAIGKYFDDIGESEAAFEHYRRANELAKRAAPRHDRARLSRATDRIIRCQSASWLLRHSGTAAGDSEQAVFIVGMPRSGTTLLEQILASHPAVHGAGEITFWGERAAEVLLEHGTSGPVALEGDAAKLAQLGREYLALLRERCPPARRVVSKWPGNFWFSGVIHAALPRARFIHVRRHPIDTCLSIYFQHFEAANAYSNDLEDLAQYYRDYERLMRHFKHLLPAGRLMEIDYEEVVRDIESAARTLLDFLELPWDARCVEFHRHPRSVLTASRWQVRQELYASSVGRWRRYARHLGPLQSLAEPPCA